MSQSLTVRSTDAVTNTFSALGCTWTAKRKKATGEGEGSERVEGRCRHRDGLVPECIRRSWASKIEVCLPLLRSTICTFPSCWLVTDHKGEAKGEVSSLSTTLCKASKN